MKLTLYQVHHTPIENRVQSDFRVCIHSGSRINQRAVSYAIRDDSGDNISHLNKDLAELVALYWIWKNDEESDIIGFEQYKRLFPFTEKDQILSLMEGFDVALTHPLGLPVYNQYISCHGPGLVNGLSRVLTGSERENFTKALDWMGRSNSLSAHNMFIMKRPVFLAYCEWLFPMFLKGIENGVGGHREYGWLAERMLHAFVSIGEYRTVNVPFTTIDPKFC